jgi:hypothetical protein
MDPLQLLKSLGLALPTPAYLVGSLLFGLVGLVAWRHGRKSERPTPKWLGLGLMLFPYAVPQTWLMFLVGAALCVWLFLSWN